MDQPRSIRAKRKLKKKESRLHQNYKTTLILKGNKTNQVVSDFLSDINKIKGNKAHFYSKHHQIFPFEDAVQLERLCKSTESSLFLFGSSSKKHPSRVIIGRNFNNSILDMLELQILSLVRMAQFQTSIPSDTKPLIIFQGEQWQTNDSLRKIKNLLQDFFSDSEEKLKVDMTKLNCLITLTALDSVIYLRTFATSCKIKDKPENAKIQITQAGPHVDLKLLRVKQADQQTLKQACKRPKSRPAKNMNRDQMGNKRGKIFVDQQNLDILPIKKRKQLKAAQKQKEALEQAQQFV